MTATTSQPNYELEALFGKDEQQVNGEWCFTRWCNGEAIEEMATEFGVDEQTLRKWIKKAVGLSQYKDGVGIAKEAREAIRHGKLKRIVALGRDKVLKMLEADTIKEPDELCRIEKTFGDRLALAENKPTDIQDRTVSIVTFNDILPTPEAEPV
jgi:hypothetical protein